MNDEEAKQFIADLLGPAYRFGPLLQGVIEAVKEAYREGWNHGQAAGDCDK